MQSGIARIKASGTQVIAISNDSTDVLRKFSDTRQIEFPLLADPESKVIKQFGLTNPAGKQGTPQHLISHPMTVLVGVDGTIQATIPETVRQRHSVDQLLDAWEKVKASNQNSAVDAGELFSGFAKTWDDTKWENDFRGVDYMRTTGDEGWKTRMEVIQSVVAQGEPAVSGLMDQLSSEHTPTRTLAAQALGYLAPLADVAKLQAAFIKEQDASARLYIVDAIGMSGKGAAVDWKELAKNEKNRDVLKHINYAKERNESPVSKSVVDELVNWDISTIDSAVIGKPAPDFVLNSVDGQEFKLSQFKGKQPVVLVFIYGDT